MLGFMGDAEAHHHEHATFILRVRLDGQDSPSGAIGRLDATPVTFNGWMDFMSTLNRLRAEAGPQGWAGPT
jgi:hypothetical protein